jgi:ATP-dependent RNA helicase RhlE
VRALILTPTRELAAQVEESVRTYGQYLPLKSTLIYGGVNINPQIDALRRGVDILVATPGRLLDHLQQKTANLAHVEILVLDEADRMLDMGFIRDIRRILALLPARRQNLLFSATFSNEIRKLADGLLHNPAMSKWHAATPSPNWSRSAYTRSMAGASANCWCTWCRRATGAGAGVHAHEERRQPPGGVPVQGRHRGDGDSRQQEPAGAHARPGRLQGGHGACPGGDGHCRAWSGHRRAAARGQLRAAERSRRLCASDRPHGRAGSTGEAISLVSCRGERPLLADIEKLLTRRIERQVVAASSLARCSRPPARPGAPAAQPARGSNPAPLPGSAPRAPQRARAGAAVALPALFRSPTRRGS